MINLCCISATAVLFDGFSVLNMKTLFLEDRSVGLLFGCRLCSLEYFYINRSVVTWYHQFKCFINIGAIHGASLEESHAIIFSKLLTVLFYMWRKTYISVTCMFLDPTCYLSLNRRYPHCRSSLVPLSTFIGFRRKLIE